MLHDSDYEAALIGNAALGQNSLSSRIGKRVRDTEGLSYNLSSRYGITDEVDGMWYVNVNVAPQNLAKAMASTTDEIVKFGREGVTEAEVEAQKSFFAGNYQVGLASNVVRIAPDRQAAKLVGATPAKRPAAPTEEPEEKKEPVAA